MLSTTMNAALSAYLFTTLGRNLDGISCSNHGREAHSIKLSGKELCNTMFGFLLDNHDKKITDWQRNTALRLEMSGGHVSGPASTRPVPQIFFAACWRTDINRIRLADGNTRVLAGLKNPDAIFPEVVLNIFEVASAAEERAIYHTYDSRESVKKGHEGVQSLFREADLLSTFGSRRMQLGTTLVTPLGRLVDKQSVRRMCAADVLTYADTLGYADALLMGLEATELNLPAKEFNQHFGGGELTGFMLFHKQHRHDKSVTGLLGDVLVGVESALKASIHKTGECLEFTPYLKDYVAKTAALGRSGSKVVPARAKHFQEALNQYLAELKATKATPVAVKRKAGKR